MKVTVGQITDKGLNPKRLTNEDNLLAMPDRGLYLVADGVGGRLGGETASQIVVDVFARVFSQQHSDDLRTVIENTIDLCNQKIYEDAQSSNDLEGMATTIALLAIEGSRAIVAHVGDSRVYRFDQKGLICLTEDHSEVNEALRAGIITAEQAAQYPRRNVISRALGAEQDVEADFREVEVDPHTSFLLCSDGITRHITDDEMARLMKSSRRPQAICQRMKELCYEGGAEDNLTAIVVDFGEREYIEEPTRPKVSAKLAQAAPLLPRPSSRIEVDLKSAQAPAERLSSDDRPRSGPPIKAEPARSGNPSDSGRLKETQDRAWKKSGGLPIKGGMSKVMKMSLLITALLAGVIIGVLLGDTLMQTVNSLIGKEDPYQKKAVPYRPRNPEINAAYVRHLEGRSDEAVSRIDKVLTANPNDAEARFFLGRIELDQKRYESAVGHLREAARLDANLPNVWVHLAFAYMGLGQTRNAMDALQRVLTPAAPEPAPNTSAPSTSPTPVG
jgi:protein phosphatase